MTIALYPKIAFLELTDITRNNTKGKKNNVYLLDDLKTKTGVQ